MKKRANRQSEKTVSYHDIPPGEPSSIQETPLTMLELRQNAPEIMDSLQKGMRYSLSYRGKTVGKLVPASPLPGEIPPDDAIFHLEDYIGSGPEGHLTNEGIDQAVYGL